MEISSHYVITTTVPPPEQAQLNSGLREIISAIAASSHTPPQLNRLVAVCHALASAFVKSKLSSGAINRALISLPASDIAYDCISDLFQLDHRGEMVQVKTYFEGMGFAAMSETELLTHLRRLVFSRVNHGLVRIYNEVDPVLGRIIRNVRLAVGALQNFVEVDRFGEALLEPCLCDPLYYLSPFDSGELEREFRSIASAKEHVPGLMSKLSLILRQQEEYCRAVPLLTAAFMIRRLYTDEFEESGVTDPLEVHDGIAGHAILRACAEVHGLARVSYIETGKADDETVEKYIKTIERGLRERLVALDGADFSYFEALKTLISDLSVEEYRKTHKSRIEYLGRMAFEKVVSRLRSEL
jgi:hypothetical protein